LVRSFAHSPDAPVIASSDDVPAEALRYGLGLWATHHRHGVTLEEYAVSFRIVHDPDSDTTHTVVANWFNRAWPVTRAFDRDLLGWWLEARDPTKRQRGLSDPEMRSPEVSVWRVWSDS
jgi:hypothetical protein